MDLAAATTPTETVPVTASRPSHLWAGKSFSFHDFLATINPLQHIPVIGTIYRAVTGDTIGNVAKVAGDTLFGGIIGAIAGAVDVAVKEITGEDIGEHVLATVGVSAAKPVAAAVSATTAISATVPPSATPVRIASTTPASAPASTPLPSSIPQDTAPSLPKFGSATTSSMLAAAAVVTPLDAMKSLPQAATTTAPAKAPSATPSPHFIPIDTSDKGIMALRAHVATASGTQPVPLNVPPGTLTPTGAPTTDAKPVDFIAKMREGLDKYAVMMKERSQQGQAASVDQLQ